MTCRIGGRRGAFAIIIAVNQIRIAQTLVNTLFMALVGSAALALGLAFGLGGRETAGQILRDWYSQSQANKPKLEQAAKSAGASVGNESSRTIGRTPTTRAADEPAKH